MGEFYESEVLAFISILAATFSLVHAFAADTRNDLGYALTGCFTVVLFAIQPQASLVVGFSIASVTISAVLLAIYALSIPWFLLGFSAVNRKKLSLTVLTISSGLYLISLLILPEGSRSLATAVPGVGGMFVLGMRAVIWNGQRAWRAIAYGFLSSR